jgi:hypothetical protein
VIYLVKKIKLEQLKKTTKSMIKFSINDRFHMYNASIEILKNGNKRSICTALRQVSLTMNENIPTQNIENYFPELKKRLPLQKNADENHRIEILIECVKEIA